MAHPSEFKGSTRQIEVYKDLTSAERVLVSCLARALSPGEIAEETGLRAADIARMRKSGRVLTAVATQCLSDLHSTQIPLALAVTSTLMTGALLSRRKDVNGRIKTVTEPANIPPAVRLAAAQSILRLAKFEEHAPDEFPDLATADPDKLREIVGIIEDRLSGMANDVSPERDAPAGAQPGDMPRETPSDYSVLD